MHRFLILTGFLLMLAIPAMTGQDPINYSHRSIFRELRKFDCPKKVDLEEFKLPDSLAGIDQPNGKYFRIQDNACHTKAAYVFIGRVNTCRSGGCMVHYGGSQGIFFEYFDYFILFDTEGNVSRVRVFRYEATHGQEITAKRWLKRFEEYSGESELVVGRDVDAISGATTSVYSITYDVQERTRRLKKAIAVSGDQQGH